MSGVVNAVGGLVNGIASAVGLSGAGDFEQWQTNNIWKKMTEHPESLLLGWGDPIGSRIGGLLTGKNYREYEFSDIGTTNKDFDQYQKETGKDPQQAKNTRNAVGAVFASIYGGEALGAAGGGGEAAAGAAPLDYGVEPAIGSAGGEAAAGAAAPLDYGVEPGAATPSAAPGAAPLDTGVEPGAADPAAAAPDYAPLDSGVEPGATDPAGNPTDPASTDPYSQSNQTARGQDTLKTRGAPSDTGGKGLLQSVWDSLGKGGQQAAVSGMFRLAGGALTPNPTAMQINAQNTWTQQAIARAAANQNVSQIRIPGYPPTTQQPNTQGIINTNMRRPGSAGIGG